MPKALAKLKPSRFTQHCIFSAASPKARPLRAFASSRDAFFILLLALIPTQAHADTLIDNVDGMTIDAGGEAQRFTGLVIGNSGRIEQILQRNDKRPLRPDFRLDGKGRSLIPGIIDSHVELMKLGFARIPAAAPGARPRPEDRDLALAEAQKLLLERGITAVTDMGTTIEDWQAYRRAGDMGALELRIMGYAAGTEQMALIGGPGPSPWLYDDHLRLNGVHLVLDGSLESRAAALKVPYADGPANSPQPQPILNLIQLKNLLSRAAIDRFQVAVDAVGDKATAMLLEAIEDVAKTYTGERRWRIGRAQIVDLADFPRFGKNGISVTMQPLALESGMAVAEKRLGPARLAGAFAWKSLSVSGARLSFGSGSANKPPEPFAAIATATTRMGADGQPFGGWQPQERLTREAALAASTSGAAWAGFAEGRFGRIAVGQRADMVLLDHNPLLATPSELRSVKVLQTWVGGRLVYQAKEMEPAGNDAKPQAAPARVAPPTVPPSLFPPSVR